MYLILGMVFVFIYELKIKRLKHYFKKTLFIGFLIFFFRMFYILIFYNNNNNTIQHR